jgi:sodium-dependent phosphate cotransporter
VHLLFNLAGTALIYPFEPIRNIPLRAASSLADIAAESKGWAVVYVIGLFYGIPVLFAVLNELLT